MSPMSAMFETSGQDIWDRQTRISLDDRYEYIMPISDDSGIDINLIRKCLDYLHKEEFETYILYFQYGRSYKEMVEILNLSVTKSVYMRIRKIKEIIAAYYEFFMTVDREDLDYVMGWFFDEQEKWILEKLLMRYKKFRIVRIMKHGSKLDRLNAVNDTINKLNDLAEKDRIHPAVEELSKIIYKMSRYNGKLK